MSNSQPVGPLVFLGDPNVGNTLVARPNAVEDADGINYSTVRFQWLRNGDPIPGATGQKYVLTNADLSSQISLTYSYMDYGGTQETVSSKSKTVLAGQDGGGSYTPPPITALEPDPTPNNSAPEGPMGILGDALVGETLVARPNAIVDADGINYSTAQFHWLRDGELIEGANGQSYVVTDADRGAQISVLYSYYDNGGSFEVVASKPEPAVPGGSPTPPPPPVEDTPPPPPPPPPTDDGPSDPLPDYDGINNPAIGKLIIYGFPVEGATLEARTDAIFDREGFDRDAGWFQWMRDGEDIPGATGDSYTIGSDDWGTSISLRYTFVDFDGNTEIMYTDPEPKVPFPAGEGPADDGGEQGPGARVGGLLEGTPANDAALTATAALDRIDGLEGVDTVFFAGDQSDYTVTFGPDGVTVTDRTDGGLGSIELDNVELIDFGTDLPVFGGPMDLRQFGGQTGLGEEAFESFVEMYIAYFNRAPDAIGLSFWATAYAKGMSLEAIANEFANQPETLATYPADASNIKFVSDVYENVLGRAPDIDGLRFWSDALNEGGIGRGAFIMEMLNGVEDGSPDRAYLDQKTDLGALFAVHRGMSNTDDAAQIMALYDGSEASVQNAVDAVDALYNAATSGENGDFLMPLVGVMDDPFAI